jgi:carboxymethylenebutenolidase
MTRTILFVAGLALVAGPVFAQIPEAGPAVPAVQQQPQAPVMVPWNDAIPPGTPEHVDRALKESTRHGEWVDIKMPGGPPLNTWVVYPERPDKSGVVLVIHDIRGMSDWARAVGDQLAQDGFIAVVPDFLSGMGPNGGGTDSLGTQVGQTIRTLTQADMTARLNAAMAYGRTLPASNGKTAVVGFCWGGTQSFDYATAQPALDAAVVYYGNPTGSTATSAPEDALAKINAPVMAFYGGNDARIGATVPATTEAMKKLGKSYDPHTFEGAGHGFLGSQANPANLKASEQAWPLTVTFLTGRLK